MDNLTPVFQKNNIILYQGDCLDILPNIDIKFNAVIADPPYGCLNKKNNSARWDVVIDFDKLWECLNRIIYDNSAVILFGNGLFSAQTMLSNPLLYKYSLIWLKNRKTGFLNANKMPLRQHEDIMVFYNKLPTYNPQFVKCLPHQKNHSRGHKEIITNRCYGDYKNLQIEITDYKYPTSIINIDKQHDRNQLHPTQKPVKLLEYLIKTYSNEHDTILDFCAGSGTTGIACLNTNRKCILIQKEDKYIELIINRLNKGIEQKENSLF